MNAVVAQSLTRLDQGLYGSARFDFGHRSRLCNFLNRIGGVHRFGPRAVDGWYETSESWLQGALIGRRFTPMTKFLAAIGACAIVLSGVTASPAKAQWRGGYVGWHGGGWGWRGGGYWGGGWYGYRGWGPRYYAYPPPVVYGPPPAYYAPPPVYYPPPYYPPAYR
jgi:hypothetical protein